MQFVSIQFLFKLTFLSCIYFDCVLTWEVGCSNFASNKGYPAGCSSTIDDVCVRQDDECAAMFCDFELGIAEKFRQCNTACEEGSSSIVEVGDFKCNCLFEGVLACPKADIMLKRNVEQSNVKEVFSIKQSGKAKKANLWGAKIILPQMDFVPVYCQKIGKPDECAVEGTSLCVQETCQPGECFIEGSCYYVRSHNLEDPNLESLCNPGLPAAIETFGERENVLFLMAETYAEDSMRVFTSGLVSANSKVGVWTSWQLEVDSAVITELAGIEEDIVDRHIITSRNGNGEPVFDFYPRGSKLMMPDKVLCKVVNEETTLTEACDTSTLDCPSNTCIVDDPTTVTYNDTPTSNNITISNTIPHTTEYTNITNDTTSSTDINCKTVDTNGNSVTCTTLNSATQSSSDQATTTDTISSNSTDLGHTTFIYDDTSKFASDSPRTETLPTYSSQFNTQHSSEYSHSDYSSRTTFNSTEDLPMPTEIPNSTLTSDYTNKTTVNTIEDATVSNAYTSISESLATDTTVSTEEPTTEKPTTQEPTTEEPTTEKPTTQEPTTEEPTTEEPTTEEPSTEEPTTEEPSTEEPTTEEPSTEEPSTEEPTTQEMDSSTPNTIEDTTVWEETTDSTSSTIVEPCETSCVKYDQYGEEWSCCRGVACMQECPIDALGLAYWLCGDDQNYTTKYPDYSDCHMTWLQNLTERVEEHNIKSWDLIVDMELYISDSALFGHEMTSVLDLTNTSMELLKEEQQNETAYNKLAQRKYMVESSTRIIDRVIQLKLQWEQLKEYEQTELGIQLQDVTESIGFAVTDVASEIGKPYNTSCEWSTLLMETQFVQHIPGFSKAGKEIIRFPMTKSGSNIKLQKLPSYLSEKYVQLESVGTIMPIGPASIMFPAKRNSMADQKKLLNSGIVSLSLLGPDKTPITSFNSEDAILVTFAHEYESRGPDEEEIQRNLYEGENPTAISGTERCVFWNSTLSHHGQWDTTGCKIVSRTRHETVCACNHLSSFALLMDRHSYVGKNPVLATLGVVCSAVSVVCLMLTLFILHFLKGIQGERNSIGKHVCFCLILGHVMSLLLLDQSYIHLSDELCIAVGVMLHYIFLAAFMWMAIEGHHLYRLVLRVFDTGRDLSKLYLFAAYGIPAIIVGVTGVIALTTNEPVYGNDDICWLSSPNYIWAFMGPILFLTTLNLLVLVLALKVAVTAGGSQKKSFIERVRIWLRGWFALSALLGVTWLFGFIYMEIYSKFAYVFIILTGLQGLFIFLSRVVFNEQVKSAFKRNAKQRAMIKRFYSLAAWKGRSSGSSMQQSSWFLAGSSSSQLDLTSSTSSSYWAHTPTRRRSSNIQTDAFSDPDMANAASVMHGVQSENKITATMWQFIKRRYSKEEEALHSAAELPPYSAVQSNEVQHAWNHRELDTLSEIPEEEDDDKWNKY